jgi:hypothetical protein
MAPICRSRVRPGRQRRGASGSPTPLNAASSIASLLWLGKNDCFAPFSSFHPWCVAVNQFAFSYAITWPTHRGTTSKPQADLSLNSFKVASNDAHMEAPESQAQDTSLTNGTAEASASSPPASPPPAVPPALSDLSTTAEQGKDGRRFVVASSCFRLLISEPFFIAGTTATSSSIAPLKKFSAVKINKRFMEQNSSAPGASQTFSSSPSSKIASTTGAFHTACVTDPFGPP